MSLNGHSVATAEVNSSEPNPSTVQRILDNALEHFSTYGYKGASVREITQASQVTKPTLYYYFKNKEELYTQLATTCFEKILSSLGDASQKGSTTRERVINFIREYSRLCVEETSVVKFVYHISLSPERGTPDVGAADFVIKLRNFVGQIVQDGIRRGEVNASKAECITYTLWAISHLNTSSLLVRNGKEIVKFETIEAAVNCVLDNALN